jgi:hypothetical protein
VLAEIGSKQFVLHRILKMDNEQVILMGMVMFPEWSGAIEKIFVVWQELLSIRENRLIATAEESIRKALLWRSFCRLGVSVSHIQTNYIAGNPML